MTPDRREELRRCEDAMARTSYELDRRKFMATIDAQEARISALESLLAECGQFMFVGEEDHEYSYDLCQRIDAIIPATEDKS